MIKILCPVADFPATGKLLRVMGPTQAIGVMLWGTHNFMHREL
jgi:hypothetical protein